MPRPGRVMSRLRWPSSSWRAAPGPAFGRLSFPGAEARRARGPTRSPLRRAGVHRAPASDGGVRQRPRGSQRPPPRPHHGARIGLCGARQLTLDFSSLTFADVTLDFRRRRALNRVSLSLNAGEIVAVLGPNGAGKTTLLFVAATLLAPDFGGPFASETDGGQRRRRAASPRSAWSDTISTCIRTCRRPRTCASSRACIRSKGRTARGSRRCGRPASTEAGRRIDRDVLARHAAAPRDRAGAHPRSAAGPARRAVHGLGRSVRERLAPRLRGAARAWLHRRGHDA